MAKMTKKDYFQILRETYPTTASNYDAVIAFIDHEIDLLNRKNSAPAKMTKTQIANEGIKQAILAQAEKERLYTITELIKEIPEMEGFANQKASAIVSQMVNHDQTMERVEMKRRAYFRVKA